MVITKENIIEELRKESKRQEEERKGGWAAANNFNDYLESYLKSNKYWREFVASKMRGEWKVKDLSKSDLRISIIYFGWITDEEEACFTIYDKSVKQVSYLTTLCQMGIEPKDWWLSEHFPVKELTMIDEIGIRYRPKAIKEELEELRVNKKFIDQRIKSLKGELKKLTV